jgi:hypothetical protein
MWCMGYTDPWSWSMSLLTQLVCTPATPPDILHELGAKGMAPHPLQPRHPYHESHMYGMPVCINWVELGKVTG